MTILVTGASGFLGSHVVEQLVRAGEDVRVLVRRSSDTSFIDTLPRVTKVYGGIEDRRSCLGACEGVTGVVHAAGLVKARSPAEFMRVNTLGTENLLEGARRAAEAGGAPLRFVFVSSQAAGGPSADGVSPRRTGDPDSPVTAYGRSKLAAEKSVLAAGDAVHGVILRPPAIYGPRDGEILVFFKAVKSGVLPLTSPLDAPISMVYGPDCARAARAALVASVPSGSTFYVEDGQPITFGEMVRLVEKALGTRAWLRVPLPKQLVRGAALATQLYGRATNQAVMFTLDKCNELQSRGWVCDGSAAREALGWQPEVPFSVGVGLTADWYRQAGWL
jgi:nucleoside-diphosphate-sugar epimerase